MKTDKKKELRCAIYTRKSVAEGLDKDFNTLDAQREAGESYIASQKHEGWIVIPKHYDDGGFSGGNMERPALAELFDDIKKGKIDIVVVYKVDRLSRSIMDFAKIVELFEDHNVSFVSVTQHFNTKDSMGRLTLNILLSFAQFERELISERIKDKMSASRKKGRWTGGLPVLGYDILPEGRAIAVNHKEAQIVRRIFAYYLENRSIRSVLEWLRSENIRTKTWKSRKGKILGGNSFSLSVLAHLLKNKIYIGKIEYEGEIYEAECDAIIDSDTFEKVQGLLAANNVDKSPQVRNKYNALLSGKVFCKHCGTPMTHSYTKKTQNKVYRYYICSNATKTGWKNCPHPSVSAEELESLVVSELERISDDTKLADDVIESYFAINEAELDTLIKNEAFAKRSLENLRRKISENENASNITELRRKETDTESVAKDIRAEIKRLRNRLETSMVKLRNIFADFRKVWSNLNFKEQYELTDLLIERIVFDGTNGEVFINFRETGIKTFKE